MNREQLTYYKDKLNEEKKRVTGLIDQLNINEMTKYNTEVASELSFYDNHPADIATETFEVEMGRALEANEASMLGKINEALKSINQGSYGKCKKCGKDIQKERLDALPYAENCIECQNTLSTVKNFNSNQRVVEESVLKPLGYGFTHYKGDNIEFDAEDSYQAVELFNKINNIEEYYNEDDDVDEIEKISNQQYKDQLPD
ncbi:TraR/DksA C4-type zinc finger protein [Clostridium weizhouense]|uniref:TraR/DksA C4-type zinc finger protein n=1 Tax=Clostridium weizhouense TaxID=2859781 RepID=A0ABS7AMI4_9CLOT|nr:TraR/DksA C4-type zinc finger protein [Clostridium weizhouense]MBW6409863.1 TraR/DksA C4-type zinc finger protein [Clostridium weizhouense]